MSANRKYTIWLLGVSKKKSCGIASVIALKTYLFHSYAILAKLVFFTHAVYIFRMFSMRFHAILN